MCDLSSGCECWTAVTRTYHEMKGRQQDDISAFESAMRVYKYYHPDVPDLDACFTVADWIEDTEAIQQ